jgi:hypothetical protein
MWWLSPGRRGTGGSTAPQESSQIAPQQSPATPNDSKIVAEVQVAPPSISIKVGEHYGLLATAYDGVGNVLPAAKVTWTSSNPSVAQVDKIGTVDAVTPGVAIVEARVGQRRSQTAVRVAAAVLSVVPRRSTGATHPALDIGWVRLGSLYGRKQYLYFNDTLQAPVTALRLWLVHMGSVRLSIREEGCTSWDSTVTIGAGDTVNIGRRFPTCPQ